MKQKHIDAHMKVAATYAALSTAKRLQVGAIVVKDNRVISIGYNGTPAGWTNECEELVHRIAEEPILRTKPEVIHAEANAIAKLARTHESGLDSDMFITHAPCIDCAKLIYGAGIKRVFYRDTYRDSSGVEFLQKCNVEVIHHSFNDSKG